MPKAFLGAMAMEVPACISLQPSLFKRGLDCLIQYAPTAPIHFNNRNLQRVRPRICAIQVTQTTWVFLAGLVKTFH
ncbi:hypothetical protein BKA82DRAFT_996501, partial [Pisolithus tinctorius]